MGSDSFQYGMSDVPSRGDCHGHMRVRCVSLDQPGSYGLAVLWGRDRGLKLYKLEAFQNPYIRRGLNEWKTFDIEVGDFLLCTYREPMILFGGVSCCIIRHANPSRYYGVDGVQMKISLGYKGLRFCAMLGLTGTAGELWLLHRLWALPSLGKRLC